MLHQTLHFCPSVGQYLLDGHGPHLTEVHQPERVCSARLHQPLLEDLPHLPRVSANPLQQRKVLHKRPEAPAGDEAPPREPDLSQRGETMASSEGTMTNEVLQNQVVQLGVP